MHVCNVISAPFPPWDGIGQYTYGFCTKLIERGHKVTIITRGSWNKTQLETVDGIEVIKVPFVPIYPFHIHLHGIFVNKVFKSLESQIDIVHIHTPLSPLIKTSLPIITTIHSPMLTDGNYVKARSIYSLFSKISARFVSYPLELKLIEASDTVTTVSKSIAKELQEYHLDPNEVKIIYNGVDEKLFYPKQKKSGDNKHITYVGRMDREKGVFDLVESGKYICNERPDVYFTLVGKGRDLDKLKQKTRKMGLEDRFKFLGQVDRNRLVEIYQDADVFVFPSYHEGLPTVILEAMSCGLPVIATDVRGNRDLISAGENGILVPPRSPGKIAETITTLIEDEKLKEKLGKNARKTIEDKYTWDAVTNRILECYELLDKNQP